MSIVSDTDILDFLGISGDVFTITSANDTSYFKYDAGSSTAVHIADGTYTGAELATALQSAMNTAFTISGTVTWSSTTRKFTFTVAAGHTLQYISTNSDGGTTIGFTASSSAALSITSDTACGDPTALALASRDAIEKWIQSYCRRTFESTTYTLEKYSGNGSSYLYLKNRPVTALYRIAVGTIEALKIKNTSNETTASVSVTTTGIVLEKDGVTDETVTFASYTTLSTLIAAINLISGWSATISSSDYNSYKSSNLLKAWGLNCLDSNEVYLKMPDTAMDDFEVDENSGMVFSTSGFQKGFNNIYVTYTAGYSSSTMPDDLIHAVKLMTKVNYDKTMNQSWNIESYTIGDLSYKFSQGNMDVPRETQEILARYRRILI